MDASDKRAPKVDVAESAPKMAPVQGIRYCVHRRLEITYMVLSPYKFSNEGLSFQNCTNILILYNIIKTDPKQLYSWGIH